MKAMLLTGLPLVCLAACGSLSEAGPPAGSGGAAGQGSGGSTGTDGGSAIDAGPTVDAGPCSGGGTLKPGDTTVMLTHGGAARSFIVHVPPGYDGSRPVPLVLDIHGLTSNGAQQELVSGWRQKSDATGFMVVYPNGLGNSWNGGALCCGRSQQTGVDDVGFLRAVVAHMAANACIDRKRVYATGISNGGAMSHLLACRAADLFAAAAPVSMGNGAQPCQPSRPLSVIMFRGTTDPLVPYAGGMFPGAQADFDQWSQLNQCTAAPQTTHGVCSTRAHCAGDVEVTLCTIDAGHVLYAQAATQGAPVPDVVWEAFQRHTLP